MTPVCSALRAVTRTGGGPESLLIPCTLDPMVGNPLRTSPHSRKTRSLAAAALAAALALAGCSSGGSSDQSPSGQSTAKGAHILGQWPLTGLPANGPRPKHPVMVVKVDNTSSSSPQIGLKKADLVTEELVEGGSTRLAAFFYSHVPKTVGPVRSFRASDIGIVKPAHALVVASGGAPPTRQRLKSAHVRTVTEGGTGFYRDSGRSAPYNLFMSLRKLAAQRKASGAPDNYFPWGSAKDFPSGKPAKGLSARFSAGHTTTWRYRGGKYVNLNSYAARGDRFRPDTVLVLRVREGNAGYRDPAGNPVPETLFKGKGDAMVFHGGRLVRGTWEKKGYDATVDLSTKSGQLELPPGNVWMELVPAHGGSVSVRK